MDIKEKALEAIQSVADIYKGIEPTKQEEEKVEAEVVETKEETTDQVEPEKVETKEVEATDEVVENKEVETPVVETKQEEKQEEIVEDKIDYDALIAKAVAKAVADTETKMNEKFKEFQETNKAFGLQGKTQSDETENPDQFDVTSIYKNY